jgi:glycosyltransferase involved in cell wall biosynthesis
MERIKTLSVVVPVYNDEEVLEELHRRLCPVVEELAADHEIVFVEDGSSDRSLEVLHAIQARDDRVVIVRQARNFGQAASIAAGLRCSVGSIVVLMDSDLQDRPEDIPRLVAALQDSGSSMAIARWISRKESWLKRTLSNTFFQVSSRLTSIQHSPQLGVFRAITRNAVDQVKDIDETTGTMLSLLYWSGLSYVAVDLNRDPRFAGKSGYNLRKMLSLTADRIFSYSLFPIKMATLLGVFLGLLSIALGVVFIIRKFVLHNVVPGWTSLIVVGLFLFGVQFIFLGLLGEYLGRVYLESKNRPKYFTERIIRAAPPQESEHE